jgi:hypothetical protein
MELGSPMRFEPDTIRMQVRLCFIATFHLPVRQRSRDYTDDEIKKR